MLVGFCEGMHDIQQGRHLLNFIDHHVSNIGPPVN
jgi:hypothetical protein